MKNPGKNKDKKAGIRLSVPLLIVLLVMIASVLIMYSIPVLTEEKRTSGNLSFTDSAGSLINGAIEISMTGAPSGGRSNVNSITWRNAPNAWIYFDALGTKSISINLRIADDSPNGRVSLEDHGASMPGGIDQPAPGIPVKYVELRSTGVSFADADVSIHYTDADLNGLEEKSLVIYSYDGGAWNELPSKVDPAKNVVTATVDSLTIFALSTGVPDEIKIRDTRNKPVISHIRTYDEVRNLKKEARTSALAAANVTEGGELEVDALESKNVAVRLKLKGVNRGEIVLDDFGKKNPVSVPLPGRAVKFVEIGARNISFSSADITIRYTDAELNGGSEDALTIYHWNGASWGAVPTIIDTVNKTLSVTASSLSVWGVGTPYRYFLTCNVGTYLNSTTGGADSTDFTCVATGDVPMMTGLLNATSAGAGVSSRIRIGTAGNGPWDYARIINNTAFSSDVNVTGINGSISMYARNSVGVGGWYELGYYDPNGAANNFVGLFNSTLATTASATQASYAISFGNQYGTIPASNKLAIRVWMNATGIGDQPGFWSYGTGATQDSSINLTIAIPLAGQYNISGYVTNASSGLPLSGATVQTNTSLSTTTNATGFYNFTGLSNQTYIVNASLTGYTTNSINVTINGANNNTANISLTPVPTFRLSGYVTNASSGAAISGADVTTNTSLTTTTNATGYYNFTLSNGTYLITASKTGYSDNSTTVTINGAAVSNANILLIPVPQSTGGNILVATNRYIILDEPRTPLGLGTGFITPGTNYGTNNFWDGVATTITATSMYLENTGKPITSHQINFTIFWPNQTQYGTIQKNTDSYGVANASWDLNNKPYYGNWTIKAEADGNWKNTSFIYNWWGCATWTGASCTGHNNQNPGDQGTGNRNSPYSRGSWDPLTNERTAKSSNKCTICHTLYDGKLFSSKNVALISENTSDVHSDVVGGCRNSSCHGGYTQHNTNQLVSSCYNTSGGCHVSRSGQYDVSNKSTLNNSNVLIALSLYSYNGSNLSLLFNATFHTPDSTVPCIICHGPMHNITKPDETQRWTRNSDTEDTHCTSCHQSYNQHNAAVSCTLCHSDDVHYIQVFSKNATGGAAYVNLSRSSNPPANCTLCHQNGTTWFNSLKNLTKAGSYSDRNPPQVAVPLEHSNNNSAGARWNQTPGYWNNSLQLSWCLYCHGNTTHLATALGIPAEFDGINVVNSSISLTSSWCSSCHWQGYTNGSDTYGSTISTFEGASLPVPPEITRNATYGANESKPEYFNHTNISIKSDNSCYGCHRNGTSAVSITGFMHNLTDVSTRVSGPDCIGCHDYNKTDTDALHRINNTDMKAGVHANLNNNATNFWGVSDDNKKCWGCHSSNGAGPRNYYLTYYDMGDRYANPYQCYDCHNSTVWAYINVSSAPEVDQHFIGASNVTAANASDNSSSCVVCHNLPELKVPYTENDTYNTGLSNASHYTTNRTELRNWSSNTTANCSYCHQNASTAFYVAMLDPVNNRNITNHSTNYNSSNPNCTVSQCHKTGWIHNITLAKPDANSTFCLNCHGKNTTSGLINFTGAVTSIKEKHNNSVNCAECHMNNSKDVHPVKYLLQNATYNTSNSTAVTCITCHQTTAVDSNLSITPPKIPSPLYHSDNASNGTIWNSYWTSNNSLTSCLYCHNDTKHNATALGRPASWNGSNTVNSSLNAGTWCSSCHYQGYSNYSNMTTTFVTASLPVPPEITNGTYASNIYNRSNYYNHSLKNYTDATCRLCHGINISSSSAVSDFMHNVTMVNTCTVCHYSFEAMNNTTRPDRYVDFSMYNTSLHRSLSCTNCHTQGHRNMGARKACEDCHAVQADPVNDRDRHNITSTPSTYFVNGSTVVNITDCTTCHNGALYNLSISTYGYWKQKDCDYCHTYPDKYYE